MPLPRRLYALIDEFKRRNVFAVVVAYTAAGLVVLEAVSVIFPAVGFAPWSVTVAVYALIGGLPTVAVLAWVYDLTPLGIIKTKSTSDDASATPAVGPPPDPNSIAVLPFVNWTGDSELEYFCDGMTEEIINVLAHLPGVKVAARTSSFTFKGKDVDVREVARSLGVALVMEGSVRHHGDRLRLIVQLVKAEDGYHMWSERYEERLEDVFDVQDDISNAIMRLLEPALASSPAAPLVRRGTENQAAYHEYLKGRHQWYARSLLKAVEHFSRAIALDPDYALAHAGLADACTYLGFYGFIPSSDARERAQAAALRAVATVPELADAHYSLGLVEFLMGWDLDAARSEFELAAAAGPGLAMAHAQLCQLFAARRDGAKAEQAATHAVELEPLAPLVHATVGFANVFLHRCDRAVESCRAALEIDANALPAVWVMATALIQMARYDDAVPLLEKAAEATGRNNFMLMWLGGAHARAGRPEAAREILAELEARAAAGAPILPATRAWIHAHLGETDRALELLGDAVAQRNTQVSFFVFFEVPGIHDDPRFAELIADTGLAEILDVWRAPIDA